jgi:putative lumazine-binding protein
MSTHVQDLDDVRAVIQLYIDGNNGDIGKLEQAFHPAARMAGRFGAEVDDNVPIADYFSSVASRPGLRSHRRCASRRVTAGVPCSTAGGRRAGPPSSTVVSRRSGR